MMDLRNNHKRSRAHTHRTNICHTFQTCIEIYFCSLHSLVLMYDQYCILSYCMTKLHSLVVLYDQYWIAKHIKSVDTNSYVLHVYMTSTLTFFLYTTNFFKRFILQVSKQLQKQNVPVSHIKYQRKDLVRVKTKI